MAINKKLIHFDSFSNFNSKKLSANVDNTQYTVGVNGTVQTGSPEILYQSIVYIKDTKQQWTHGQLYGNTIVEGTYSEIKQLKDSNKLVAGNLYAITDYTATTIQSETRSAGKVFGIIIEAITTNAFSEDAIAYDSNQSFTGNKLEAWTVKYCFTNDTTRFAWADTVNGKGVIYYLKDEFNNECWYDFKNIQFARSRDWFNTNNTFWCASTFLSAASSINQFYFYTFSVVNNGTVIDDSLYSENNYYHASDNHLGRSTAKLTKLNNTIFIDAVNKGIFNITIADGHSNNTIGKLTQNNTIEHNFKDNIISESFQYNTIGSNFTNNVTKKGFSYNTIEGGCTNNIFYGSVNRCIFQQAFSNNNFIGESLAQCTFGSTNQYIKDIPTMRNVTLSKECIVGSNSIYLNNLQTSEGHNLLSAINSFNDKFEYTIMRTDNDKYSIFSHNVINKISNIYDLGSVEKSGDAENSAKNPNIGTNPNISLIKYYVSSSNKTGIIEQMVGPTSTTQFITWDGVRKYRVLTYRDVGGNLSLTNNPSWTELKILSTTDWNNRLDGAVKTTDAQTISGVKTFNNNINLIGKTQIATNIDSGELKVLHNNSSKGFIIRTKNTDANILPLEILTIDGSAFYQYNFPTNKGGNIALIDDIPTYSAITGVKGDSESAYRTGNVNITKANIGLGNVDNTADSAKSVNHAISADSVSNSLTIGTQTYNGSAPVIITAADLGLSSAFKYCGITTTAITDGATTNPVIINNANHTATNGCTVSYNNSMFVWTGSAWEELGNSGNYKIIQSAVSDPTASGNSTTFIASISQDANGKITATKKTITAPIVTNNLSVANGGKHTHSLVNGTAVSSGSHSHTTTADSTNTSSVSTSSHTHSVAKTNSTAATVASSTHTHTVTATGSVGSTFTGTSVTSDTSSATTSVATAAHTHSVTGTVASGGASHSHSVSGTTGSAGSGVSISGSESNGVLTITVSGAGSHTHSVSFTSGSTTASHSHTFSSGAASATPNNTTNRVSVASNGHTHSVTAAGSIVSTFTGSSTATNSITGTTDVASSSHTHATTTDSTNVVSVSKANHTHAVSGDEGHTHTVSGTISEVADHSHTLNGSITVTH